jgi:chromate transporter
MNRLGEIFGEFLKLGLTSFGGPSAHIAYFRERFVARLRWLDESEYAALVALAQFLPGPGSSQMGMAIGWKRGGLPGSFAAFAGFTLPSALLMIGFALGVMKFGLAGEGETGWIRGLQIAVVVVIANAVRSMAVTLCRGKSLALIALAAAAIVLGIDSSWTQIGVIAFGAVSGWILLRGTDQAAGETSVPEPKKKRAPVFPVFCLLVFAAILCLTPWMGSSDHQLVSAFGGMYRSGALVFGGGHVVLPLLSQETVDPGWIGDAQFAAGYGAAQAVPGPIFTIASYLGALLQTPGGPWLSALICTIGIFLPGWLLMIGTLPFWEKLRSIRTLQNALAGTNAAVVGLLGAALYDPVWSKAIDGSEDVVFLLGVAALLLVLKLPAWLVVISAGLAGGLLFG